MVALRNAVLKGRSRQSLPLEVLSTAQTGVDVVVG